MPHHLLPTMLTLCNFACGVLAIYAVFEQKIGVAILLISLGLVLDVFDGWTARKLNAVATENIHTVCWDECTYLELTIFNNR